MRVLLGVVGIVLAAYGGWLVLQEGLGDATVAALWLAGGVLVHDAVLAPLVIGACFVGGLALPPRWRAPAAGGLLVLGTITVMAVPVLGRFGARADNPTLLDRPYWAGWLVVAAIVLVGVVVSGLVRGRPSGGEDEAGTRRASP